jgi:hypothetical protein
VTRPHPLACPTTEGECFRDDCTRRICQVQQAEEAEEKIAKILRDRHDALILELESDSAPETVTLWETFSTWPKTNMKPVRMFAVQPLTSRPAKTIPKPEVAKRLTPMPKRPKPTTKVLGSLASNLKPCGKRNLVKRPQPKPAQRKFTKSDE